MGFGQYHRTSSSGEMMRFFLLFANGQTPASVFFHLRFIPVTSSTGLILTETGEWHLLAFLQHLRSLWEVPKLLSGNST